VTWPVAWAGQPVEQMWGYDYEATNLDNLVERDCNGSPV